MRRLLSVGDRVRFDGELHQVAAVAGTWVRLVSDAGAATAVLVTHLMAAPGFEIVEGQVESGIRLGGQSLADVPKHLAEQAREWECHVLEVDNGIRPDAPAGAAPRQQYDPETRSLQQREQAKADELAAAGYPTSLRTVQRMRHRYQANGLRGLVDGRALRRFSPIGRTDERVVAAIQQVMDAETSQSTGTRDRLRRRIEKVLVDQYGQGTVELPSKSTFNRLVSSLSTGRHTFGSAATRRSLASRPSSVFTPSWACRPGQQVQIDTTVLDVMAVFDDGQARRVELTAAVDVATRTICAAVLRPAATKAVDASLLLARMTVPEPMRPDWAEALAMSHSRIPYRRLADIDARLEGAAAKPVIMPETIVCDRGAVYMSSTFTRACQRLEISLQPSHPHTPTDKGIVERTFASINTLFCQHVAGYTGRDVTMRGSNVAAEARWSMPQLQELLDEWIIIGWQQRPHSGLISPDTGTTLSPNDMYAVLVSAAGYLPIALTADDYIELLPSCWRTINAYGVKVNNRTYNSKFLRRYSREHSTVTAKRGQWEVAFDPYDATCIWVRNHHKGGWIRAEWTHLPMVSAPFADFTWRHAQQYADDDEDRETATARALNTLLQRAETGPDAADARITARDHATVNTRPPIADIEVDNVDDAEEEPVGPIEPLGIFDAQAEAERWPW